MNREGCDLPAQGAAATAVADGGRRCSDYSERRGLLHMKPACPEYGVGNCDHNNSIPGNRDVIVFNRNIEKVPLKKIILKLREKELVQYFRQESHEVTHGGKNYYNLVKQILGADPN